MGILKKKNIQKCRHELFWISMKLSHGYFEYSWSDVMSILNVQKLTSSEYSKADVRCKYSWNDLMGILNIQKLTSLTFWIFMRWRNWYFEYKVRLWNYSEADSMGILNIHSDIGIFIIQNYVVFWIFIVWRHFKNIQNTNVTMKIQNTHDASFEYSHDGTSWVFKIPMTSLHEYSKYPW